MTAGLPALVTPTALRHRVERIYERKCVRWLGPAERWPLQFTLGVLREATAAGDLSSVRTWVFEWRSTQMPAGVTVDWEERRWRLIGSQDIPSRVIFDAPQSVAAFVGRDDHWGTLSKRYAQLTSAGVRADAVLAVIRELAKYASREFESLLAVIDWALSSSRQTGLYPRQLPVEGVDTKWIEDHCGAIESLLRGALPQATPSDDLYALLGLRRVPVRVRIRILDPALRAKVGGLCDIEGPVQEIASIVWKPLRVIVVENIQAALMLPDIQDTVAILGLGYAVDVLASLRWATQAADALYWGDIDTHGLACLASARAHVPALRSILMNSASLLANRELWVEEPAQKAIQQGARLTVEEQALYHDLVNNRWGKNVRLEQERLPMTQVNEVIAQLS